ncbi:MAG: hypothetical protein AAGD10_18310 [Myxococcota bacterium]
MLYTRTEREAQIEIRATPLLYVTSYVILGLLLPTCIVGGPEASQAGSILSILAGLAFVLRITGSWSTSSEVRSARNPLTYRFDRQELRRRWAGGVRPQQKMHPGLGSVFRQC